MPRAAFPSGRKSLLLLLTLAVAIIGGAWWWTQRPPPEPVHNGQRLSEWLASLQIDGEGPEPVTADMVHDFGPGAVPWLVYTAEHGRHPFKGRGPLPFDKAPDWLRGWLPQKWGGLRPSSPIDECIPALRALASLGPEAGPAIPALARILERESARDDYDLLGRAAIALNGTGPTSWPVVEETLEHGNLHARQALLGSIDRRMGTVKQPALEGEGKALAILFKACDDPDTNLRERAAQSIAFCCSIRPDLFTDPLIDELVRLLSNSAGRVRMHAAQILSDPSSKGARAVPRLIELLNDREDFVRMYAASALGILDTVEKVSVARLRVMSSEDPSAQCRLDAELALKKLGGSTDQEAISPEATPGR